MTEIMNMVEKNRTEIFATYAELHKIPEESNQEFKTTAFLYDTLVKTDIKVKKSTATGLIAEIDSGLPGMCVGVRADIDALPFSNKDGSLRCIHACGHDSHSTMVLWTMLLLKQMGLVKHGKVRAIFQPAEEKLTGAKDMLASGAMEGVEEFYGVHLRPIQELAYGKAAPALLHGSSTMAEITIHGHIAHSARPHLGCNAIDGAVQTINGINAIWLNPAQSWSAKVTRIFSGGKAANIIPDKAVLSLDMRTATNKLREELLSKVKDAYEYGTKSVGCTGEFKTLLYAPAAEYDQVSVDNLASAIETVLGKENLVAPFVTTGSDDFHFYKQGKPELKTAFLALGAGAEPGMHHPDMHFNSNILLIGTKILMTALANRTE